MPCLVPENICLIPRKALPVRRICLSPGLLGVAVITNITPAHVVTAVVGATVSSPGFCTTSEIWLVAAHVTSISPTPSITALSAVNVLMPIPHTMPYPRLTTRIGWLAWLCGWWSRMGCHINKPVGIYGAIIEFLFPSPRFKTGSRVGGKKAADKMESAYPDWALADFSGYIAIDELYDGPFCVLSMVDNHTFKRILYQVLDHSPEHKDIEAFLRRFKSALEQRGLLLQGITTDGSPLYPEPLQAVFGAVPHQICEFHIIKELTKAILRAVAKERKKLAEGKPKVKRGRPYTKMAKRAVRKRKHLQQKVADLFEHRYLFVRHELTPAQLRTLQRITRGLSQLRSLRAIIEKVYRLFDRRCRSDTALAKLAKLRQRVRRFKQVRSILSKLESPNLDKALTFLDDRLLPSTSNAVERGNRRHRKMQKTVYRVRTQENINNRIALDMLRDFQKEGRTDTIETLHYARAG